MKKTAMTLISVMMSITGAAAHTVMDELKGATGNPDAAAFVSIPVPEAVEIKIDTLAPAGVQQFIMESEDAHIQSFFEKRHHAHNEGVHRDIGHKGSEQHHGKVRRHARREAGKDGNGHNHRKVRRHDQREAEKNRNGHSEASARKSHSHADSGYGENKRDAVHRGPLRRPEVDGQDD